MSQEMVTVTIDGIAVSVPKGTTIIEAAKQAGVLVPHYCYHPSLPAPAVCRMCLVEVEKAPKLMPACVTTVAEGQVVHVQSEKALEQRKGVLEFLLINHPLDCPICDQSGECELQDYTFQEGRAATRYTPDFAKRYNPVEDFGPDIIYVPNRCILCTRCVRFMGDVAQEPTLNVSERGDRAFIGIAENERLDHPWSGNVVDLCPVGSLLSKDFLHKARVWDLDKTGSICPGCSQGCNITIDMRDDAVVRLKPRPNMDVNRHFMCDHGRLDYRWMNRGDRVEAPLVRNGTGAAAAADWDHALDAAGTILQGASGRAVILASGRASVESLGLVRKLVDGFDVIAAVKVPLGDEAPLAGIPDLALRRERVPNIDGARLLGYAADWDAAVEAVRSAAVVIVLDADLSEGEANAVASSAGKVIALSTLIAGWHERANVVLPVTTMVEESGVYINRDQRAQRFQQAKAPPAMARPAWWAAGEILAGQGPDADSPASAAEAFALVARGVASLDGLTHDALGWSGQVVKSGAEVSA
ncbi:MAG TPA: 2Fe-2S iron-sulfur cluster-binding protein [Gemmatimonadales bacterium]|nr:2Fe-2S iron-sulfur cluster-binding protein [Gemmatimonadales bacterium]